MARQRKALDDLVRATQQQINEKQHAPAKSSGPGGGLPRGLLLVAVLWLSVIGVLGFQFEEVRSWLFVPSDTGIEQDLKRVLEKTALAIEHRRDDAGRLPLRLPNPALQGLVRYERLNDVSYRLVSTVGDVTVEYTSASGRARRTE